MGIEWTEDLSTSIETIDNQHRELFRRVNILLDACGQGKGRDEVGRVIGFFEDYVITHFSAEERIMTEAAYPWYDVHKAEHEHFIGKIKDLKKQFLADGAGLHVVLLTVSTAVSWLANHIRKTDKALGEHLRINHSDKGWAA